MLAGRKVKAILIDLSGTLHIENTPINGAVEALKRLRSVDVGIRFVTNTSKESKRILHKRVSGLGFDLQPNEMLTSLTAARQMIDSLGLRPLLLLEDVAMEDFEGVPNEPYNAVVVGLAPSHFHYKSMNQAFRLLLQDKQMPLIAINKGRYHQTSDGPSLGPGPFVTALEYATDKKAKVIGKPEKDFFLACIEDLGCSAEDTVMLGDDVRDDIKGAQDVGMIGMLVKTGKYREGDENKIDPPPNYVFQDFPSAVEFIITAMS